jgi:hypothetical protein
MNLRGIHEKGVRGKSNVIKRNVEKVWGARYTLGERYLTKNTVTGFHYGYCNMFRLT